MFFLKRVEKWNFLFNFGGIINMNIFNLYYIYIYYMFNFKMYVFLDSVIYFK